MRLDFHFADPFALDRSVHSGSLFFFRNAYLSISSGTSFVNATVVHLCGAFGYNRLELFERDCGGPSARWNTLSSTMLR